MQHVARVAGVNSETLTGSLEKMNVRLAEVATDASGPAAQALRHLGLSASTLAEMADGRVQGADRRHRRDRQSGRTGQGGRLLVREVGPGDGPIAAQGKEGIAGLEAEAEALGLAVSGVDSEKIGEANDALDRVWGVVQGLGNTLAVELAPYITYVADLMVDWAKTGDKSSGVVSMGMNMVIDAIGGVADVVQVLQTGWQYLQAGFAEAISYILGGVQKAIDAFGWLYEKITGVKLEVTNLAKGLLDAFEAAAIGEMDAAEAAWNKKWGHERVREFAEEIQLKAEQTAQLAAGKESSFRGGGALTHEKMPEFKSAGRYRNGVRRGLFGDRPGARDATKRDPEPDRGRHAHHGRGDPAPAVGIARVADALTKRQGQEVGRELTAGN